MKKKQLKQIHDKDEEEQDDNDEKEDIAVNKIESWHFVAHVHGKDIEISAGDATQRVKWLGHVAISRWDDDGRQGWKRLGIPIAVKMKDRNGSSIDLSASLRDVLQDGDRVFVETSLAPNETS